MQRQDCESLLLEGKCVFLPRVAVLNSANIPPLSQLSNVAPKKFRQNSKYTTYVKSNSLELCPVFVSRVALGAMVGSFENPVVPTGAKRLVHKFCITGPDNLFRQAQVSATAHHAVGTMVFRVISCRGNNGF